MKIGIYYGGRGIISDPTLYVIKKLISVFEELNVTVERYDLYDQKNLINTLPQTFKDMDGIILATTVEWHGVGGYINTFLDACWLYGDKEKMQSLYMAPVVMSTTYGEKDAELDLIKAWVTLGGLCAEGISGYVPDVAEFEQNDKYGELLEKCAENIYRAINQKKIALPVSTREISRKVSKTRTGFMTQKETEQLSEYISDEKYVSRQKADIRDLTMLFKDKLSSNVEPQIDNYIKSLRNNFVPKPEMHGRYQFVLKDTGKSVAIRIDNVELDIKEGEVPYPDSVLSMNASVLEEVISGKKTFDEQFRGGLLTAKGDFKYMRLLDELFQFDESK